MRRRFPGSVHDNKLYRSGVGKVQLKGGLSADQYSNFFPSVLKGSNASGNAIGCYCKGGCRTEMKFGSHMKHRWRFEGRVLGSTMS